MHGKRMHNSIAGEKNLKGMDDFKELSIQNDVSGEFFSVSTAESAL